MHVTLLVYRSHSFDLLLRTSFTKQGGTSDVPGGELYVNTLHGNEFLRVKRVEIIGKKDEIQHWCKIFLKLMYINTQLSSVS